MADSTIENTGSYNASPDPDDYTIGQTPSGATYHTKFSDLPGGGWIYGDGSDGPLTLHDGDFWLPGFYTDVTIEAGATVRVSTTATFWPIFRCTGTFTILGTLDLSGIDAVNRTGAVATFGAPGVLGAGVNGSQTVGDTTQLVQSAFGLTFLSADDTPTGGAGGDGSAGGGGSVPSNFYQRSVGPKSGHTFLSESIINAPIGGSGGGGDSTNYGGGGGGGGAWATICARHVVHGANNLYLLNGGAGAPGGDDGAGNTGNGDCGGGGGGGGAYWLTISDTIDAQPAYITTIGNTDPTGTGGLGGAGCGTGTDGSPGDDGFGMHLLN